MGTVNKGKTFDELPDILTAQDIADYLKISRRRIYELLQINVEHGGIPNFEVGISKRVMKGDFNDWLISKRKSRSEKLSS